MHIYGKFHTRLVFEFSNESYNFNVNYLFIQWKVYFIGSQLDLS